MKRKQKSVDIEKILGEKLEEIGECLAPLKESKSDSGDEFEWIARDWAVSLRNLPKNKRSEAKYRIQGVFMDLEKNATANPN